MATTSLIINSTTADGKAMTTVTDVNANVLGTVYNEFGRKLNALTTNTFGSVNRLDKSSVDEPEPEEEEPVVVEKTTPTLTLSPNTATKAEILAARESTGYYEVTINYNGDGELSPANIYVSSVKEQGGNAGKIYGDKLRIYVSYRVEIDRFVSCWGNIKVNAAETDTYEAATATFTITEA